MADKNYSPKYRRNDYVYYKSIGICVNCNKRRARPGKVNCARCAAARAQYRKEHGEANRKSVRDFYWARKEGSLCRVCGKPSDNGIRCKACATIYNAKNWLIKKRKREGRWTGRLWDETTKEVVCYALLREWGWI